VTGTNGKTTTTRLLAAALAGPEGDLPVSNDTGSNMPAGHVAALAGSPSVPLAVLEVDEGYLGRLITEAAPAVVVLLNLSRDQLDRISEVRMLVDRWRLSLAGLSRPTAPGGGTVVVANADDPMVAFAASAAPEVCWVGAGQVWHDDAVGCPACGGRIGFADDGAWACDRCEFARPEVAADVDGSELVLADGTRLAIRIGLPGHGGGRHHGSHGRDDALGGLSHGARASRRCHRGGRPVLDHHAGRTTSATSAGQEPGGVDGHLRPLGRDGQTGRSGGPVGQRPHG
jgi:UDP-N-acetylmuramyl tripeptide synthase